MNKKDGADKIEEALKHPVTGWEKVLAAEVIRLRAQAPKSRSEYRRIEAQGGNALEMALVRIKTLEAQAEAMAGALSDMVRGLDEAKADRVLPTGYDLYDSLEVARTALAAYRDGVGK